MFWQQSWVIQGIRYVLVGGSWKASFFDAHMQQRHDFSPQFLNVQMEIHNWISVNSHIRGVKFDFPNKTYFLTHPLWYQAMQIVLVLLAKVELSVSEISPATPVQ